MMFSIFFRHFWFFYRKFDNLAVQINREKATGFMRQHIFYFLLLITLLVGCTDDIQTTQKKVDDPSVNVEDTQKDNATVKSLEDQQEELGDKEEDQNERKNSESLESLTVHYLDVGQGDATLFAYSDGKESYNILYDVGDWKGNEVVPYLQQEKIQYIDLIIISHPHADHMGQLEQIINHFEVGEIWMSGNTANTKLFQTVMEAVLASNIDYDEPRAGEEFDIGSLELSVLHPGNLTGGLNEDSLSIRFTYGEVTFLFTGDAYEAQEQQMMQQTDDIQADFLQLGHHGSDTSSNPSFIDAVNPSYAIYSAGAGNSYGHPHESVVELFQKKGVTLYGTDVHGTIIVQTDGITYKVSTEKEGNIKPGPSAKTINKVEESVEDKGSKNSNSKTIDCIDINHASKEELQQITQIGEVRAEQLIDLRPFSSVNELTKIKGIGDARLEEIKQQGKACVGGD